MTFWDEESAAQMREYMLGSGADLSVRAAPSWQLRQPDDATDSVFTAPVETLLETPLQAAGSDGDSSTGALGSMSGGCCGRSSCAAVMCSSPALPARKDGLCLTFRASGD